MDEAWGWDSEFLMDRYEEFCRASGEDFQFTRDLETLEPVDIEGDRIRAESIIKKRFPSFSMTPSSYTLLKIESRNQGYLNMDAPLQIHVFSGRGFIQGGEQ